MDANDTKAINALAPKFDAEIGITYKTRNTRLHVKAWMFHRDSGFSGPSQMSIGMGARSRSGAHVAGVGRGRNRGGRLISAPPSWMPRFHPRPCHARPTQALTHTYLSRPTKCIACDKTIIKQKSNNLKLKAIHRTISAKRAPFTLTPYKFRMSCCLKINGIASTNLLPVS